jgi:hypothetical protein
MRRDSYPIELLLRDNYLITLTRKFQQILELIFIKKEIHIPHSIYHAICGVYMGIFVIFCSEGVNIDMIDPKVFSKFFANEPASEAP